MSAKKDTNKKLTAKEVSIESIQVKLKPVLGIKPRTYVPVIWLIIISILIFISLILPGIKRNGTFLTVESLPPDASVIIDGIRLGTTADEIFVSRGERILTVQRKGFIPDQQTLEVSGRVFASLIFPLKKKIIVILSPVPGYNHLSAGTVDFYAWAGTGPKEGRYAIPPVMTQTARDMIQSAAPSVQNLSSALLPMAVDERHVADILRAEFILESSGTPAGAGNLTAFINNAVLDASVHPKKYLALLQLINQDRLDIIGLGDSTTIDSEKTQSLIEKTSDIYTGILSDNFFPSIQFGKAAFISIPELTAPIGDIEAVNDGYNPRSGAKPVNASVGAFLISAREVSNNNFAAFTTDNPKWSFENRDLLLDERLTDKEYLSNWTISGPPPGSGNNPVTEISWYAAEAYAQWFTDKYLESGKMTARLPNEDEWEVAARLNRIADNTSELSAEIKTVDSAEIGTLGIRGLAGNVREWAQNPYRFNENLFRPGDGSSAYQNSSNPMASPERPVRGGAYIDKNLSYPAAIRGGLAPDNTSPVIGFRLVIVSVAD